MILELIKLLSKDNYYKILNLFLVKRILHTTYDSNILM